VTQIDAVDRVKQLRGGDVSGHREAVWVAGTGNCWRERCDV
jgi:hypothetical protein